MTSRITSYSALLLLFLTGCRQVTQELPVNPGPPASVDLRPGSCPHLSLDDKGRPVLSWARALSDSTAEFCFAVSENGGTSFGRTIAVPGSGTIDPHAENLPKVLFKPSGEIIALWGAGNPSPKNKYAGLLYYAQSFDGGRQWTAPQRLVRDSAGQDQRYFDVALLPDGEAAIIWLDNRKTIPQAGSALYFARTEGNRGFQQERLISQPCCPCCRTDLFVDVKGGIHVLYRGIVQDSIRDMVHAVSADNGNTFSSPVRISEDNWVLKGCPHTGPVMTENQQGLQFAWFTGGGQAGCYYTNSKDGGKEFLPRELIRREGAHPQMVSLAGGELLLAWDEAANAANKKTRRIAVQQRTAEGEPGTIRLITPANAKATYPVLLPLPGKQCLLAYTVTKEKKEFIEYRTLTLE